MYKNYFKIAWRNIARHKLYTTLNVLGLALGICACLVIYLITSYEFSFDRFHKDKERIYRVTGELLRKNGEKEFLNCPIEDVGGIEHAIPGFEAKAGLFYYEAKINIPGDATKEFSDNNQVIITWPGYFSVFNYEWLAGNSRTALADPYKVVLAESQANKYFGTQPAAKLIGKTVVYNDSLHLTVSGIVKDWKGRTDFPFTDFISIGSASHNSLKKEIPSLDWRSLHPHGAMAFVKLDKKTSAKEVDAKLAAFIKEHAKPTDFGTLLSLQLQPLTGIHFTKEYYREDDGDNFRKAHLPTLYALMGIALFILVIAVVNFVSLSTAQSTQRAKEVGIRKVLGSNRRKLVLQFLSETFVLTFIAILVSLLLVNPVLTLFKAFIPPLVTFDPFNLSTICFVAVVLIVTSLLAGFYPAKVLSAYLPVLSLKGANINIGSTGVNLRKALTVFQFSISLIFIIGSIVISNQVKFMRIKDKGFKTDAIFTINNWADGSGKMNVFAEQVKQLPGVEKVLLQGTQPMGFGEQTAYFTYKSNNPRQIEAAIKIGDEGLIPFYEMKMIAGRNMLHSDSLQELVVNEAFCKAAGFASPMEAIGKPLFTGNDNKSFPIVGVVADFHQSSFHHAIQPLVIQHLPQWETNLAVRLETKGKLASESKPVIAAIEKQWKVLFPDRHFDASFLDESISWLYEKDEQTGWLMNAAMTVTIFISCMGLFGLAMFTAEKRTKEIGIRKVLGASVMHITMILSREFVQLIGIAVLIASPVAGYFMNQWMNDFVYRTNINGWVFLLAGGIALLIGLVTVSSQAIKAALADPVKSLRTE